MAEAAQGAEGATASGRPGSDRILRLRLFLVVALGYAYIALLLLLAAGLSLLHFYFWGLSIPFVVVLIQSLRVRIAAPKGTKLHPQEAPQLFREVQSLARRLTFHAFHEILLTDNFNAAMVQVPLWGLVGWHRSYLLIGLPLLEATTPEQFRAILAHEFFHHFGGHGEFSNWLFRVSATWDEIVARLNTRRLRGDFLLRRFAKWYGPILARARSRLSHAQEHGADRFSADMAGAENAAGALVSLSLKDRYLGSYFWAQIWSETTSRPDPPNDAFARRAQLLRGPFQREWSIKTLEWLMRTGADASESHPGLATRLKELNQPAQLPGGIQQTAAEFFLGDSLPHIYKQLTEQWRSAVGAKWRKHYEECAASEARLQELQDKLGHETLTQEERAEHAVLARQLRSPAEAAALLEPLLASQPESAFLLFHTGSNRLQAHDGSGVELLESAMKIDEEWIPAACEQIAAYHEAMAEMDAVASYAERHLRRLRFVAESEAKLALLPPDAILIPHNLTAESVPRLAEALGGFRPLRRAYCVQRKLPGLPQRRYYCVCLEWRPFYPMWKEGVWLQRIANAISFSDGPAWFFAIGSDRGLRERLKAVPGALVYRRRFLAALRKKRQANERR